MLCGGELVVVTALDLHIEHLAGRVAESDQAGQLSSVLADPWRVRNWRAALESGDLPSLVEDEASVLRVGQVEVAARHTTPGSRRLCSRRWEERESSASRVGDQRGERDRKLLNEIASRGHRQFVVAVHAAGGGQLTEDSIGMCEVVLIHLQRRATVVHLDRCRTNAFPRGPGGLCPRYAATQHEQVDHHVGARGTGEGSLRETDGSDQIGHRRDLSPGRRVAGVEGVAGGERDNEPAGAGQVQRLDEEVVVQGVAAAVVARVVRSDLGEGQVADHQVEGVVGDPQLLEAGGVDRGSGGVEVFGDLGGRLVEFDAGQPGAIGSEADEVARPATGLEHPHIALDAERAGRLPHRLHDRGRRVVGVERRAPRLGPALLGPQQTSQLGALFRVAVVVGVEHQRDRTPTRPAGEHQLFVGVAQRPPSSRHWFTMARASRLARSLDAAPDGARSSWLDGLNAAGRAWAARSGAVTAGC